MKKVTLTGFICLAVMLTVMSFGACAQQAQAPAPTVTVTVTAPAPAVTPAAPKETVYSVLDPRGIEPERPFQAISPRLDTLKGKKVGVVNLRGGNEIVMETIAPAIKKLIPECNVVYYYAEIEYHQPRTAGDWKFIESCDAVIIGHDY